MSHSNSKETLGFSRRVIQGMMVRMAQYEAKMARGWLLIGSRASLEAAGGLWWLESSSETD
jgi:hypothetical protein